MECCIQAYPARMPKFRCPYPECTYETDDANDALPAVLLSVHSAGAHSTQTGATAQPQPPPITARVEKVRRPTVNGHILSLAGKNT